MSILMFAPAPIPSNDTKRGHAVSCSALRNTGAVYEELAKSARRRLQARWAGVCLIAEDWQHVVASSGGMLGMYRRSTAISSYVVAYPNKPFVVLDAARDHRFAGNPFVADGLIRFYAGAPIRDIKGFVLGALCVTDLLPRMNFSQADSDALQALAGQIV